MNGLIVFLAVVGAAMAQYGPPAGPQETPEVAAARAAHLSALARAGGNVPAQPQSWNAAPTPSWNAAPAQNQWNAAPAPSWNAAPAPSWNAPAPAAAGVPADTPEVAAAKAAHFAALAKVGSPAPGAQSGAYDTGAYNPNAYDNGAYNPAWNAPPAQNQWNAAPTPSWNAAPAQNQWNAAPAQNQWNAPAPSWNAPQATPGLPAETPEVAAARAAHLAAHQAAGHRYRRSLLAPVVSTVAVAAPLAYAAPVHLPLLRSSILLH